MDWLSFFIGALVAWISEWAIDLFHWRRKYEAVHEENRLLRARLEAAQAEIRLLEKRMKKNSNGHVPAAQSGSDTGVSQVEPAPGMLVVAASKSAGSYPDGAAGAELGGSYWNAGRMLPARAQTDDLAKIEGIGPRMAQLLNDHGIRTFAQLASTPRDRLSVILHDAGPRFRLADPGSWPQQARLAADGAWEQLRALQSHLSAGR